MSIASNHFNNKPVITDKYVFFSGGSLSNFYPCEIGLNNLIFKSSEQIFQWSKAFVFKDQRSMDLIYNSSNPKRIKTVWKTS